jgi:catechol-2,3-dioxygenase
MNETPSITCVSEIVLNVTDLPKAREFYMRVMGFPLLSELSMEDAVPSPDGKPTLTFLTICETNTPLGLGGHPQLLALIDYRRHVHARRRFVGHDASRSTLNHLAFEIPPDSFDDHAKRLNDFGIDLSFSDFPAMNARAMFFKDPEGNVLELICNNSSVPQENLKMSTDHDG